MKQIILSIFLAVVAVVNLGRAAEATPPAAPKDPDTEQRLADLEAYINNVGRGSDTAANNVSSKIAVAGPGHNAWMMTSAALVLFMTLPGLALF